MTNYLSNIKEKEDLSHSLMSLNSLCPWPPSPCETEQDPRVVLAPHPTPPTMASACLLSTETLQLINKFNQQGEKNEETKENSQTRLSNSSLVIKHSQGHLIPQPT